MFYKYNCFDMKTWYLLRRTGPQTTAAHCKRWKNGLIQRFEEVEVAFEMDDIIYLKEVLEVLRDSPAQSACH